MQVWVQGRLGVKVLLLWLLAGLTLAGQTPQEAAAYFQAKEWAKAAEAYEAITKENPKSGQAWFRLGFSRHNLKQYREAMAAYEKAEEIGFAPALTRYNLAGALALSGEKERAFAMLQESTAAGFGQFQNMEKDSDLESLRSDARFAVLVKQARINSQPCEELPEYRQFDFWIGEWGVFNPRGQKAGENRIERLANGCILWENWTGAGGGTGHSINYYDHARKTYVQIWVSSGAGIIVANGGLKDGALVLTGERFLRNGTKQHYRGTWTPLPDGNVRQFLELSSDEGKTWTVWFNGLYVKKKQ